MTEKEWAKIAMWALVAFGCELYVGFSLSFAPGWANKWPFGISIYSAFSTGMAILFFVLLMTVAVGLGAVVGAALARRGVGLQRGRAVFVAWLVCSVVLALGASRSVFRAVYQDTLETWPNGYNP